MPGTYSAPTPRYIPIMIFIDGGYLKKWIEEESKIPSDKYDFGQFSSYVANSVFQIGNTRLEVIRTYFYDGLASPDDPDYKQQKSFHNHLVDSFDNYEVRIGQLVRDGGGKFRQKGVDVLMAIDMIDKAYSNQFDIAIVVAGDLDHLEAIKTVKNNGKQVFGIYSSEHVSDDLLRSFDKAYSLQKGSTEGTFVIRK